MRRGLLSVVIACSALLFAAGCGSSSSSTTSSPTPRGTAQIAYRNIAINPDTIRVKVGSTLVWTDYDDVTHNVTSQSGPAHFASANLNEGSKFSYKVTKPGLIHYECTHH